MFKKMTCIVLVIFTFVFTGVLAFANGSVPPKISSEFEIIEIDKDDFLSLLSSDNDKQLAVDIINKTNISNNDVISVTSVRNQNEISVGLCVASNGGGLTVKSQKIDSSKKYQEINVYLNQNYKMLSFVYNLNGSVSGVNITDFPASNYVYGQYINSNLSCAISKISSNYNYIDGTIKQIKFVSKNNNGGGMPTIPTNPDSILDIPDGNEYVPYDTKETLGNFFKTISSNVGVATNIGLWILAIILGISIIIRIVRKYSKV